MRELPILFNAPMVRAILEGRKTMTRRIVKPTGAVHVLPFIGADDKPTGEFGWCPHPVLISKHIRCPYGQPGDRLWVITLKPIAFGGGKYAVGDDGHVYDVSGHEPRRRKTAVTKKGYEEISLRASGDRQNFRVNRLVAEAFYGRAPDTHPVCRHLNGQRRDNRPVNLDWGTEAQNTADANAAGAWSGAANGGARLSQADIDHIRVSSEPQAVLAQRYGITQPTISKIKNGKLWRAEHPLPPPPNMERWASRITMEVTDVRVERLQDISEADARSEGVGAAPDFRHAMNHPEAMSFRVGFAELWEQLHGAGSWDANPWVWGVSFKRIEREACAA